MENTPKIRIIVANNIKKYRKMNNLTQEALAELADISNTYIANIECGQTWVSDKTLEKIATALHIDEYLLFIPESVAENDKSHKEQMETIKYLSKRKKEFSNLVNNFFSETFNNVIK